MSSEYDTSFKIIVLGDSGVGKTAIVQQYCLGRVDPNLEATIGVQFQQKFITIAGSKIKLAIWDTAGQEKYRGMTRTFYRNVDGVILVYDISDSNTLKNLKEYWIPELQVNVTEGAQIMLVGNKSDLKANPEKPEKMVTTEQGKELAREYATLFVEASAKTCEGVQNAFEELVQRLMDGRKSNSDKSASSVKIADGQEGNNSGFCC